MEKTIKAEIKNSEIFQSSSFGGVQGEKSSRSLKLTFDNEWDGLSKEITFLDAYLKNPVKILLNQTNKQEDNSYLVTIPSEALKTGGRFVYIIEGKKDGCIFKSLTKSLKVHYSPDLSSATEPESMTPDVVSQLNIAVQKNADEISANANEISANKEDIENIYNDLDTKKEKLTKIELNQINLNEKISANKNDITSLNNQKADQARSLFGYGIEDAYTKTQTDSKLSTLKSDLMTDTDTARRIALSATRLAQNLEGIKADKTELEAFQNKIGDIETALKGKANKATTLSDYGIRDAVKVIGIGAEDVYTIANNYTEAGVYVFHQTGNDEYNTYTLTVRTKYGIVGMSAGVFVTQRLVECDGTIKRRVIKTDEFGNLVNPIAQWEDCTPYTKTEIDNQIGDIETALDSIIAIQNELTGGESV